MVKQTHRMLLAETDRTQRTTAQLDKMNPILGTFSGNDIDIEVLL